jgi:hypothetical protein
MSILLDNATIFMSRRGYKLSSIQQLTSLIEYDSFS